MKSQVSWEFSVCVGLGIGEGSQSRNAFTLHELGTDYHDS